MNPLAKRLLSSSSSAQQKVTSVLRHYDTNVNNVPRLPIPSVSATMTRYLETISPLVSKEDLERNKKLVNDFVSSPAAQKLQSHLLKVREGEGYPYHYFETAWDDMYYGGRWPLMVHVNPFFSLADEAKPQDQDQLKRAAKYATSMVRWWRKVVELRLEPDMEKGKPLDGYQYPLVFGVERVPHETRDLFIPHGADSRHIIVLHRHQYHRVDVIDPSTGAVLKEESLLRILEKIRGEKGTGADQDVGLLTTGDRAHYARARHEMTRVSPALNGVSFRDIDTCLFVVVLEDFSTDSLLERGRQNLHSTDGSNRWFDKHQLIVHADGALGMCLEHGCNDGMTWLRMLTEVWHDTHGTDPAPLAPLKAGVKEVDSIARNSPDGYRTLEFDLKSSPKTQAHLQKSADDASALVDDVDSYSVSFKDFGRDKIKNWKISPDAAMQMAFQLAYSRTAPSMGAPAVYESCAMKPYFHGRTETIRSCTNESQEMVRVFNSTSNSVTKQMKIESLTKAANKHVEVANGARSCTGPNIGVDRHMLGLRTTANDLGVELPAVFSDPAFSRSNTWILSTSNVTTPFFDAFGFGAVTEKGYGLGYMTLTKTLPVFITSFLSGQKTIKGDTSSKAMGENVVKALRDFNDAFEGGGK